jgi:hypothetical protein
MRFRGSGTLKAVLKMFSVTRRELVINCCVSLEELERIFPASLAVIGVHSAKFENEKLDDQIQHAIQRCGK